MLIGWSFPALKVEQPEETPSRHGRLFLSGPITGMPDGNKYNFSLARNQLLVCGFDVEDPSLTKGQPGWTWQDWMRSSIAQMMRCEGVALMPGWNYSKGAQIEKALAEELGIPVMSVDEWRLDVLDHG